MSVLVLIHVVSKCVVPRNRRARCSVVRLGIFFAQAIVANVRLDANVLVEELLGGELRLEVLRRDEATLLLGVFLHDLVEAFDDSVHHPLEAEVHRLVLLVILTDVFLELLVDLVDDSVQPVFHILVSELDLLFGLNGLLVELLSRLDLDVQLVNLWVARASARNLEIGLLLIVLHLELVKLLSDLLVLTAQPVQFLLVVADGMEQLRVGSLPREELLHDLLNVRKTCLCANLLKCLLYLGSACHLTLHL